MSSISRRQFLVGAGVLCIPRPSRVEAQAPHFAKVGFLFTPSRATSQVPALFAAAMRDIGWVEGRNLTVEWRFADGQRTRLPELAKELVQQRVQVIVAPFNIEADAARRSTDSVPIVMLVGIDPVGSGFAKSLIRPGGNITGVVYADSQFSAKSVQLIKEANPATRRLGYLYPSGIVGIDRFVEEIEAAARANGLTFHRYPLPQPADIEAVLTAMKADRVDSLRVSYTGAVQAATARLLEFATSHRIATCFTVPTAVEAGGLMSYSPKLSDNASRGAALVDKLLKGAAAAELPFEYPRHYELVVNVRAAKELGLALPQSILQRADRVIE